jgi:hypothetical protein
MTKIKCDGRCAQCFLLHGNAAGRIINELRRLVTELGAGADIVRTMCPALANAMLSDEVQDDCNGECSACPVGSDTLPAIILAIILNKLRKEFGEDVETILTVDEGQDWWDTRAQPSARCRNITLCPICKMDYFRHYLHNGAPYCVVAIG